MVSTPSNQILGKFAVDDSDVTAISDFDANSFQYEFLSESMQMRQFHVAPLGTRGTRSMVKDRVQVGSEVVGGRVVICPTPVELDQWFPRILGNAESADSFTLAETVPVFSCLFERIQKRFIYTGCYVNRATFSGGSGQQIMLELDILGKSYLAPSGTSWPGTIPSIDSGAPYVFSQVTFALAADASATEVESFRLTIDNDLQVRAVNSTTVTAIFTGARRVGLDMVVPYGADEVDLIRQAVAGGTGSLTFTNGGCSTLFSFANLKCPNEDPISSGRVGEYKINLSMAAYMSSSTRELIVTHDSAP